MSTDPNSTEPPQLDPPPGNRPAKNNAAPIAGFLTGAVFWLLPVVAQKAFAGYAMILPLVFACFALPVIAVILAIIRRTRRFGLGLLLSCGLGWLVLGAICGGLIGK